MEHAHWFGGDRTRLCLLRVGAARGRERRVSCSRSTLHRCAQTDLAYCTPYRCGHASQLRHSMAKPANVCRPMTGSASEKQAAELTVPPAPPSCERVHRRAVAQGLCSQPPVRLPSPVCTVHNLSILQVTHVVESRLVRVPPRPAPQRVSHLDKFGLHRAIRTFEGHSIAGLGMDLT